jgi:hypothetical protein
MTEQELNEVLIESANKIKETISYTRTAIEEFKVFKYRYSIYSDCQQDYNTSCLDDIDNALNNLIKNNQPIQILDILIEDNDTALIFTENPDIDLLAFKKAYNDEEYNLNIPNYKITKIGEQEPKLYDYTFLKQQFKCILLWYDYENPFKEGYITKKEKAV